ncbi:hypothetical protein EDD17DRAFT_1486796, partial [Pisolithus thermaeus]
PSDIAIGSVGGGPARHILFKDSKAPPLFSSKWGWEAYMNSALRSIPRAKCRPVPISLVNRIFFTQSEMNKRSLLLDESGKVCIVDFKDSVLLPESIVNHTS